MKKIEKPNDFFFYPEGKNKTYNINKTSPEREIVRAYCNKLLEAHLPYCGDNHFLKEVVENPQQRWWEMYLSWCFLKVGGYQLAVVEDEGPDLCIILENSKKLWIEAIAVRVGNGDNEVQRPPPGQAGAIPTEKMLLRITSGFDEKVLKIKSYLEKGIITKEDHVFIAINTGEMRDSDLADLDPPLILQALMAYGPATMEIPLADEFDPAEIKIKYPQRNEVKKNENTSISMSGLLNPANSLISGVISSTSHLVDVRENGADLKFFLNPGASCGLDPSFLRLGNLIKTK